MKGKWFIFTIVDLNFAKLETIYSIHTQVHVNDALLCPQVLPWNVKGNAHKFQSCLLFCFFLLLFVFFGGCVCFCLFVWFVFLSTQGWYFFPPLIKKKKSMGLFSFGCLASATYDLQYNSIDHLLGINQECLICSKNVYFVFNLSRSNCILEEQGWY